MEHMSLRSRTHLYHRRIMCLTFRCSYNGTSGNLSRNQSFTWEKKVDADQTAKRILKSVLNDLGVPPVDFLKRVRGRSDGACRQLWKRGRFDRECWHRIFEDLALPYERFFPTKPTPKETVPTGVACRAPLRGNLEDARLSYAAWVGDAQPICGVYSFLPFCMMTEAVCERRRRFLTINSSRIHAPEWNDNFMAYYADRVKYKEASRGQNALVYLPRAQFCEMLTNTASGMLSRLGRDRRRWIAHVEALIHDVGLRIELFEIDPIRFRYLPDSIIRFGLESSRKIVGFDSTLTEFNVDSPNDERTLSVIEESRKKVPNSTVVRMLRDAR